MPTTGVLLVLFHGLEGSSRSHYAQGFADYSRERGMAFAVPHFRGCSGEPNHAPRAYHSGDHEEIGWILQRLREAHRGPMLAVGVSLGGNALLRWAAEAGSSAGDVVSAVAAVCSPVDLAAGGLAIGRGFNRLVYTTMFMRTMKPKALAKLAQHPGLFDRVRMEAARDLHAFDDIFTAPLHGFRDAADYYARASAKPHLHRIRIPALLLNARNDPFVPAWSLPVASEVGPHVTLWQPEQGGHVGFPDGRLPDRQQWMPHAVGGWLGQALAA
jgi:predicted alpha/beta-fold hydrolase